MVREMGLEPIRRRHTHLKRACLPIPALAHMVPLAGLEPARSFLQGILSNFYLGLSHYLQLNGQVVVALACY